MGYLQRFAPALKDLRLLSFMTKGVTTPEDENRLCFQGKTSPLLTGVAWNFSLMLKAGAIC
jgi:hypothetical protein